MIKPCALDEVSPLQSSTSGQEQFHPTQLADNFDGYPSITTSTADDFEEYLDLLEGDKEKDRYKADPHKLKRDLEINERMKGSFSEAKEATPAQQISSRTISTDQEIQISDSDHEN